MTMPENTPGGPPWGPPPGFTAPYPPAQQARNGLGVAALIVGIAGVVFGLIPILFWISGLLGILALIFGLIGHSRARQGLATNKGMALAGTILGGVSLLMAVAGVIITVMVVKDATEEIKKEIDKVEASAAAPDSSDSSGGESSAPKAPELKLGDTYTYKDGVKVTVSKPSAYEPDEFAVGHKKGNKAVQLTITIVNGSNEQIDITTALPDVRDANGAEAEQVFDGSNATTMFNGKLLPGKQAVAKFIWSLPADAATSMELQMEPELFKYETAIWSGPVR
ncbi:hypothetical protein GCM10020367_19040 [Streptomyces sannanensis]|uniref:DUF4190 domain-containing protein n=1 Tax=Streptomyces sannanensis TaxID=285536 RepID=A0ABP6S8X5_9ACTN